MKIQIKQYGDDYEGHAKLLINEEEVISCGSFSLCPEDANLARDLSFFFDIPELMKQAYEADKNGEELEILGIEDVDEDEE